MSSEQHISMEMDDAAAVNRAAPNGPVNNQGQTELVNVGGGKKNRSPRGVTEVGDDDDDDRPLATDGQRAHGVDDGFLQPNGPPRRRRPSYAFPDDNDDGFIDINGVRTAIPDVNAYQQKKTLAQGMMDLALLSANANQLRYVLESYRRHPYYYPSLIFISMSIIFQIIVGMGLILNGRYNINNQRERCRANRINNYTVIGIFIVTVVNVFISSFGVADPADLA